MKFLFDENIASEDILKLAISNGYSDSSDVYQLGLDSLPDSKIIGYCISYKWIAVTKNIRDYRTPYQNMLQTHPGLICLMQSCVGKAKHLSFFQRVINEISNLGLSNLNNKIVEVTINSVTVN